MIITSSSDEKLARAKKMGADFAINYRTNPNWSEEVMRLTEHKGANLIIETGGPETLNHSLQASSFNGQIVIIGAQAGADQGISPLPILFKKALCKGLWLVVKKCLRTCLIKFLYITSSLLSMRFLVLKMYPKPTRKWAPQTISAK